jgi:Ca2+-binding RTX toxin-like protein
MRRVLIFTLAALALPAASASAAIVAVTPNADNQSAQLELTDDGHQANDVTAVPDGGAGTVLVRDAGAPLAAGAGCVSVDAHAARCSSSLPVYGRAWLGDGDDRLRSAVFSIVDAGAGEDTVELTGRAAEIDGGAGDDVLHAVRPTRIDGGPGDDRIRDDDGGGTGNGRFGSSLVGGDGDDVLTGGPLNDGFSGGPGSDRLDGRGGADRASWISSHVPVHADLAAGTARIGSDRDRLISIESATGGPAADTLLGTAGANRLGSIVGEPDTIVCRGGADRARLPDGSRAARDCERLLVPIGQGFAPVTRSGLTRMLVRARPQNPFEFCGANVKVERGGRTLAFGHLRIGRTGAARLPATARGRALLRSPRATLVRVRYRVTPLCPGNEPWDGPTRASWLQLL